MMRTRSKKTRTFRKDGAELVESHADSEGIESLAPNFVLVGLVFLKKRKHAGTEVLLDPDEVVHGAAYSYRDGELEIASGGLFEVVKADIVETRERSGGLRGRVHTSRDFQGTSQYSAMHLAVLTPLDSRRRQLCLKKLCFSTREYIVRRIYALSNAKTAVNFPLENFVMEGSELHMHQSLLLPKKLMNKTSTQRT